MSALTDLEAHLKTINGYFIVSYDPMDKSFHAYLATKSVKGYSLVNVIAKALTPTRPDRDFQVGDEFRASHQGIDGSWRRITKIRNIDNRVDVDVLGDSGVVRPSSWNFDNAPFELEWRRPVNNPQYTNVPMKDNS